MDFRRGSLSLPLSLLMSAFALLIPPAALTGPPSSAYRTLRYRVSDPKIEHTHSFGVWLEPRYIFGAKTLI